jgi:hypothetical protein
MCLFIALAFSHWQFSHLRDYYLIFSINEFTIFCISFITQNFFSPFSFKAPDARLLGIVEMRFQTGNKKPVQVIYTGFSESVKG